MFRFYLPPKMPRGRFLTLVNEAKDLPVRFMEADEGVLLPPNFVPNLIGILSAGRDDFFTTGFLLLEFDNDEIGAEFKLRFC